MSKYIVYPSGFIGSDSVDIAITEAQTTDMHMKVGLFKTRLSDTKDKKYCKMTQVFYNKYFGKQMDMATITELMRLAYKHIGDSPLLWLKRHNDNEYKKLGTITKYHGEFLCETMAFAYLSETRKFSMQSWQKYLMYGSDDSSISSSAAYKKILNNQYLVKCNIFYFLANWLAMPNGQQDILATMQLMYGQSLD